MQWAASSRACHKGGLVVVAAPRHVTCIVICLAVKRGVSPNERRRQYGHQARQRWPPSGAGETFTTCDSTRQAQEEAMVAIPLERLRALPATARCVGCSRRPHHFAGILDKDDMGFSKSQGRSLVGSGTSVRRDKR